MSGDSTSMHIEHPIPTTIYNKIQEKVKLSTSKTLYLYLYNNIYLYN